MNRPSPDASRGFLDEHRRHARRALLRLGAGATALTALRWRGVGRALELLADEPIARDDLLGRPELARPLAELEPYLTKPADFRDISRGTPKPHSLDESRKREVGLTRDTWRLEVISDPEQPATIAAPLTREAGTALDFDSLLRLAADHAVRFPKVMTCLNIGCPLGMGIWEGVPLREVLALVRPRENVRRVWYHGYHNDDPQQMFRSSLPLGRVLEDYFDLPPVILCYKLNGEWLDSQRGGPVRMVVPEAYGFKSVKWLSHVVLSNLPHANDTYASGNNDLDSPLKSFAATLFVPEAPAAGEPLPITGYAQVGISGVSKVQVWVARAGEPWPDDDEHFLQAPWVDATLLPAPKSWGGDLPNGEIPAGTRGFDEQGRPTRWPLPLAKVHWAALLPGLPAGEYLLRSRTVDSRGVPQPLPRPLRKSGHAAIEAVPLKIRG